MYNRFVHFLENITINPVLSIQWRVAAWQALWRHSHIHTDCVVNSLTSTFHWDPWVKSGFMLGLMIGLMFACKKICLKYNSRIKLPIVVNLRHISAAIIISEQFSCHPYRNTNPQTHKCLSLCRLTWASVVQHVVHVCDFCQGIECSLLFVTRGVIIGCLFEHDTNGCGLLVKYHSFQWDNWAVI